MHHMYGAHQATLSIALSFQTFLLCMSALTGLGSDNQLWSAYVLILDVRCAAAALYDS